MFNSRVKERMNPRDITWSTTWIWIWPAVDNAKQKGEQVNYVGIAGPGVAAVLQSCSWCALESWSPPEVWSPRSLLMETWGDRRKEAFRWNQQPMMSSWHHERQWNLLVSRSSSLTSTLTSSSASCFTATMLIGCGELIFSGMKEHNKDLQIQV